MKDNVSFYPIGGCPICSDMFKDFFIFCVQNKVPYTFRKDVVVKLAKPAIRWGDDWYIGDEALDKFKCAWKLRMDKNGIQ